MKKVPFDCIGAYRLNPQLSGVAKFNTLLAGYLNFPIHYIFDDVLSKYRHPLLSFKVSDLATEGERTMLIRLLDIFKNKRAFSVFLHTFGDTPLEWEMINRAEMVYCGNREIYLKLSSHVRAIELWSPPLIGDTRSLLDSEITIFSFGMAHKIHKDIFLKLKDLLEKTEKSYSILMSTAFHESVTLNESLNGFQEIQDIFGDRFYHLGFLSDVAVVHFLRNVTFFAAFFEKGVRDNNSTVNAAMQQGAAVITNFDAYSPPSLIHFKNVIDIDQCTTLPLGDTLLDSLRAQARQRGISMDVEMLVQRMNFSSYPL